MSRLERVGWCVVALDGFVLMVVVALLGGWWLLLIAPLFPLTVVAALITGLGDPRIW